MNKETKTTSGWTAGPWCVDDPNESNPQHAMGGNRIFKVIADRPYGGLIADVSAWWVDTESARANARLIATAPEMATTIRELVECLTEHVRLDAAREGVTRDVVCPCETNALAKARALLARIGGGR